MLNRIPSYALAFLAAPLLSLPAFGQEAEDPGDGDVVYLSPFVVDTSRDIGYLSSNAISGTSLNTEIKDLPMALQVINQEFIRDIGATDLDEALAYTAGVFTSDTQASSTVGATRRTSSSGSDRSISSAGGGRFSNTVYIRGLPVPFQNRMGFRYGGIVVTPDDSVVLGGLMDMVNVERMEVVRGPNSILYGVGVLTGIVNVIPERPLADPHYEFSVQGGSDDYMRFTAEATGPIFKDKNGHTLSYRLAGAYDERASWIDWADRSTEYYAIQLEHQFRDKATLFLEYQNGFTRQQGIGTQWFYDDTANAKDTEFRNQWDENYNYARHQGPIVGLLPLVEFDALIPIEGSTGRQPGFRTGDNNFVGGAKPDDYRITGPDTFAERDEWNFLANLDVTPFENFTISGGVFYAEQETYERNIRYESISGTNINRFYNDEILRDPQLRGIWESGGIYGWRMQDVLRNHFGLNINPDPSYEGNYILPATVDDIKLLGYSWVDSIVKAESFQWRVRATYTFDTPFIFSDHASHTFLVGYNYINDVVDFPEGGIGDENARANTQRGNEIERQGEDGWYFRSIANFDPIYFDGRNDGVNGHNVVRDGDLYVQQDIWQRGIYGVYHGKYFDERLELIGGVRRDTYNADQFIHKRVNISDEEIIARAQTWAENTAAGEAQYTRGQATYEELLANLTANNQHVPTFYEDYIEGGNAGYFDAERFGAPDASFGPVPYSQRQVFERDISVTTNNIGLSYNLTEALTIYGVYSEGVMPNTALRDGNGDPIEAEQTANKEIGFKFDFFDRKLSGSIAYFEIDRENAIWNLPIAPNASGWSDAIVHPNRRSNFDPVSYDPSSRATYLVKSDYFVDYLASQFGISPNSLNFAGTVGGQTNSVFQEVSRDDIPDDPNLTPQENLIRKFQIVADVRNRAVLPSGFADAYTSQAPFSGSITIDLAGINPEGLDDLYEVTLYDVQNDEFITRTVSPLPVLYNAFMDRTVDFTKIPILQNVHPIRYNRMTGDGIPQLNNNVDFNQARGALVTFDEKINGVDLELIYTATSNLQFVINYAHVERKAKDTFDFTGWRSIATGEHPFVPAFTLLHREFGWENAGIQLAWVDYDAYAAVRDAAGDAPVSISDIDSAFIEYVENVDEQIPNSEFSQRYNNRQQLLFINPDGTIINENSSALATDMHNVIEGVSLNYNPEDNFTFWSKYTFTEGTLKGLQLNLGVDWTGSSKTSVAFNSVSPINDFTLTPEVSSYYQVQFGASYRWEWNDLLMRLSFNVYNLFEHTYDVSTYTVGQPHPITGQTITKRQETFHAPRRFRVGLAVSF